MTEVTVKVVKGVHGARKLPRWQSENIVPISGKYVKAYNLAGRNFSYRRYLPTMTIAPAGTAGVMAGIGTAVVYPFALTRNDPLLVPTRMELFVFL